MERGPPPTLGTAPYVVGGNRTRYLQLHRLLLYRSELRLTLVRISHGIRFRTQVIQRPTATSH